MENKGLQISSIIILCIALFGVVLCTALIGVNPLVSFIEDSVEGVSLNVAYASEGTYTPANGGSYYADVFAYVVPATAENKTVTWSVAWEDELIQDDIDDYFDLEVSQGTENCKVICKDSFKNKDAILTCTTNVGGFKTTCRLTWVGNIKSIVEDKSLDSTTYYYEQAIYMGMPYNNYIQHLELDDNGYAYFDYQVGDCCEYRSDRSFNFYDFAMFGEITYGRYDTNNHTFINTSSGSSSIVYATDKSSYGQNVNSNCPANMSDYIACLPFKAGATLNPSNTNDCCLVSFGWNPYLDQSLWSQGNGYITRPYNVNLWVFYTVEEETTGLKCTVCFKITFDTPTMLLSETSIEF